MRPLTPSARHATHAILFSDPIRLEASNIQRPPAAALAAPSIRAYDTLMGKLHRRSFVFEVIIELRRPETPLKKHISSPQAQVSDDAPCLNIPLVQHYAVKIRHRPSDRPSAKMILFCSTVTSKGRSVYIMGPCSALKATEHIRIVYLTCKESFLEGKYKY